jgi:HSP20 family protein
LPRVLERRYGAFERSFRVPEGVDADNIEASFKHDLVSLVLPNTPEAQKAVEKIVVKSG